MTDKIQNQAQEIWQARNGRHQRQLLGYQPWIAGVVEVAVELRGSRGWGLFLASCLSVVALSLQADAAASPQVSLRGVTVDGTPIPLDSDGHIRLPAQANTATFTFGASESAGNVPIRFRCQLDGYETVWQERTERMRLLIRFEDDALNEVAIKEFAVTGESPGWTGNFSNSPCVQRKESVWVPTNATRFWIVFSSSGPAGAVGVYGVKNLQFTRAEPEPQVNRLITKMEPINPETLAPNRRSVAGWQRSGLRLTDAQVVRSGPERDLTLVLVDTSHEAHVDWITPKEKSFRVQPGTRVVFEWEEFYSIGLADSGSVTYENLPAGLYRFRMGGLSVMGVPVGSEASVAIEMPVAYWKTSWFWSAVVVALSGLVMAGWRLSEWRRMKFQLAAIEKTRAIEQERFRIAQDIHDDLGARVTQISLLSSAAQKKPGISPETQNDFASVSQMSRSLVEALYETVWAVSPENDHLDSLVTYICQAANQMCAQAGLKCRLRIPDLPHDTPVTSGVRHNLVMTIKEAIHNVIKHAEATEVQISIGLEAQLLRIEVADNGTGFDSAIKRRGNGLANMKRRMEAVGGQCIQHSEPGAGTQIRLELALAGIARPASTPASKPQSI